MLAVLGVDRELAHPFALAAGAGHEVDPLQLPAGLGDRRGQFAQRLLPRVELDPDRDAVLGADSHGGYRIRFGASRLSAARRCLPTASRIAARWLRAALVLYGVSLTITFGVRVAMQLRRTGSTGLHGLPPDAGPLEWVAGGMFVAGLLMGGAAPILALLDVLEPIPALDGAVGNAVGLVLGIGGIALTFGAQLAMGDAWRVGVDPEERTELVTDGPFRLVRNPIYSAMLPTVFGLVLMVPSVVAIAAIVTLFVALELQVRLVEEPYLLQVHGDDYADYAARVGRFVPGLGLASNRVAGSSTAACERRCREGSGGSSALPLEFAPMAETPPSSS